MEHLFQNNTGKKIGVIGDSILDEYIFGSIVHKDVKVFKQHKKRFCLGGAANVALNVKTLGYDSIYFSAIGSCNQSKTLYTLLKNNGILTYGLVRAVSKKICCISRLITSNKILMRIDGAFSANFTQLTINDIYRCLELHIQKFKVLILSDYQKGCITEQLFILVKNLCCKYNVRLLVDCKSKRDFSNIYLMKINLSEFTIITKKKYLNVEDIKKSGIHFKKENGISILIITMDNKGLIFINEQDECRHLPSVCKEVIDSCGAGDSMIAALGVCICNNIDINQAVVYANIASAVCCSNMGTYAVKKQEVKFYWEQLHEENN